jgi:DNA-binding MarR family transcriptional regulator
MERRIEERLVYGIVRAEHELRVVLDNALRELGVTLTQWTVLSFLLREPGLSAADLARRSFISQQGVAGILTRLERAGLVARTPHPTHGRIVEVTVTSAGRALADYCDEQVNALETRLSDALGSTGQAQFTAGLAQCRTVFREFGAIGDGRVPELSVTDI